MQAHDTHPPFTVAIEARPAERLELPVIHPNGSGRKALAQQLEAVQGALEAALDAMAQAAPHGRDYYVVGPHSAERALRQHQARMRLVEAVQAEMLELWQVLAPI